MRTFLAVALVVAVVVVPVAVAQQSVPVAPAKTALAWTAPTTKADGTPVTDLAGYEVAISDVGADLNAAGVPLSSAQVAVGACGGPRCKMRLADLAQGLPDAEYRLWVRAVDFAGNASAWAGPVGVQTDSEAPPMPTGLKIEVVVTVGG